MKRLKILQLIASLCLLAASVINLVEIFTPVPFALSVLSLLLLFAALALYAVDWGRRGKR